MQETLKDAYKRILKKTGKEPTVEELAKEVNIPVEEVKAFLNSHKTKLSSNQN